MIRSYESKTLTVTTYGYEGRNMNWMRKIFAAVESGYECFTNGKYVYMIENEWTHSYIVTKYLKSDCIEFPAGWLIDDRARRYAGRLVARVEVRS